MAAQVGEHRLSVSIIVPAGKRDGDGDRAHMCLYLCVCVSVRVWARGGGVAAQVGEHHLSATDTGSIFVLAWKRGVGVSVGGGSVVGGGNVGGGSVVVAEVHHLSATAR